jgi:3-methyladenine DNA glycosylase AlkC
MTHNLDTQFYRVVAVLEPARTDELMFVTVVLQNIQGNKKEERIMFTDAISAWEFYRTQKNILIKQKNSNYINK